MYLPNRTPYEQKTQQTDDFAKYDNIKKSLHLQILECKDFLCITPKNI